MKKNERLIYSEGIIDKNILQEKSVLSGTLQWFSLGCSYASKEIEMWIIKV